MLDEDVTFDDWVDGKGRFSEVTLFREALTCSRSRPVAAARNSTFSGIHSTLTVKT